MDAGAREWAVTFAWLASSALLLLLVGIAPALIWCAGLVPGVLVVYRWGDAA